MVREGIYQSFATGASYTARAVFVLRRGTFIGVGHMGGVYEGTYWVEPGGKIVSFDGCVRFEPGTKLVTGAEVGQDGLTMTFKGKGPAPRPDSQFTIPFEGVEVSMDLKFISPLPA